MFAATGFILALIKDSGWLKGNAEKLLRGHKGKINTSGSVMTEVALMCKRQKTNTLEVFYNSFELVSVDDETCAICMKAVLCIEKYGLNVFDSFHAAYCNNGRIISSDSVYEKVSIEGAKLDG